MNKIIIIAIVVFLIYILRFTILNFIFLSSNGSFFSSNNMHDVKDSDFNLEINKHHFLGNHIFTGDRNKFNEIVKKLKFIDIFSYQRDNKDLKTVIHRKNSDKPVNIDDVVSVTTRFMNDKLFTTSYEKVAVLEETDNSFIMCMTSCSENIINGYYRIKVDLDENKNSITINYAKVQSLQPFIMRILLNNNSKYVDANINSVKNTINFLSGQEDFKIENVIHEYK